MMNDHRVYRYLSYKTRQASGGKRRLPWALRTCIHLGIPLNRVKDIEQIPGVGGMGQVVDEWHPRGAPRRFARAHAFMTTWWCVWHYDGRWRCSGGPRGRMLRDGCNKPKIVRNRKRSPPWKKRKQDHT